MANPIISDFYKATSDSIPDPVSVESLDDTPVEVDLYNYSTFPDAMQPFWLANSSSDPYLGQYFLLFWMLKVFTPALVAPSIPSATDSEPSSLDKSQVSDPSLDFLFYLKDLDTSQGTIQI